VPLRAVFLFEVYVNNSILGTLAVADGDASIHFNEKVLLVHIIYNVSTP
jgi:hypothetical protein